MTVRQARLSEQARRSLARISEWTYEQFGERQADSYIDALVARVDAVAQNEAPHQSCRNFFAADLRADLRFTRSGRHFIIFLETPTDILILDFIHVSADIGARLGGPDE